MKRLHAALIIPALTISIGCAPNIQRIKNNIINRVDPISITDQFKFTYDLDECSRLASEEIKRYRQEVLGRVIVGGLVGAAVGLVVGKTMNVSDAGQLAGLGAISGSAAGAASTPMNEHTLTERCMRNRGYLILY